MTGRAAVFISGLATATCIACGPLAPRRLAAQEIESHERAAVAAGVATPEQLPLLETFRDEFVALSPGSAEHPAAMRLGDDARSASTPAREVRFVEPFAIARYEVPQNLWEAVMGSNPSRWKGPRNSVEMVSFDDAIEFCRRVTVLLRYAGLIGPEEVVRLPSEAEWEYAARSGTPTAYSFGDDAARLGDFAWFHGNAAGNDPPVGAKLPNAWGLHDVHGYLWEWCLDPWHETLEGAPGDARAWQEGGDEGRRPLRGGSWKDEAAELASAVRRAAAREFTDDAVGLRCVLARDPEEEGFQNLVDESLSKWNLVHGQGAGYVYEQGVLVCPADGGGNLFTRDEYSDFVFRFDFRLQPGGNNGVGIRSPLEGDPAYVAMEIQILDDAAAEYATLQPYQYCGSVYGVVPARRGAARPAGQWNTEEIRCQGRHVRVTLNGATIVDADLDDVKDSEVLKVHPGLARERGHIGFLGHGTRVEFRHVRVKDLSAPPAAAR